MKHSKTIPMIACLALLLAPAVYAQCTSTADTAEQAARAAASAEAAEWPLPIPSQRPIRSMDDFHGALLLAAPEVYQIVDIKWQITSDGNLNVRDFIAYTRDGILTSFTRADDEARVVESPADFNDFLLGNPTSGDTTYHVDFAELGVDRAGFVAVRSFTGTNLTTGEFVAYAVSTENACGLRTTQGCDGSKCVEGACGGSPSCPCNGTSGACTGYTDTVCSGKCPGKQTCNGSVNDCKCV